MVGAISILTDHRDDVRLRAVDDHLREDRLHDGKSIPTCPEALSDTQRVALHEAALRHGRGPRLPFHDHLLDGTGTKALTTADHDHHQESNGG